MRRPYEILRALAWCGSVMVVAPALATFMSLLGLIWRHGVAGVYPRGIDWIASATCIGFTIPLAIVFAGVLTIVYVRRGLISLVWAVISASAGSAILTVVVEPGRIAS